MTKKNEDIKKTSEQSDVQAVEDNPTEDNVRCGYPGISIVIPYLKSEADGQELRMALRSWQAHFKDQFHVVIIGDKEDWFDEEAILYIPVDRQSSNPQVNLMVALKMAVAEERVTDVFIWSNDDIYILNDFDVRYIASPLALGIMQPDNYNGHYRQNMLNTIGMLPPSNYKVNYGTHTPFFFEKEKIKETFEKFPEALKGECLFESLYFEGQFPIFLDWQHDNWLLPIVSVSPRIEDLNAWACKKLFMNNNTKSYSPTLEKFLYDRYPEQSRFEVSGR